MHDFGQKLTTSLGERQRLDLEAIQALIPGCVSVIKTDTADDVLGVDYVATLRNGAEIYIDAKSREKGASKYWRDGVPELALETWSIAPGGKFNTPREKAKTGWLLCEKKKTDMIYYTFDPSDSHCTYLLPFQHLRMAFLRNHAAWTRQYKPKPQDSIYGVDRWQSICYFIPAPVVIDAISAIMCGGALLAPINTIRPRYKALKPESRDSRIRFS